MADLLTRSADHEDRIAELETIEVSAGAGYTFTVNRALVSGTTSNNTTTYVDVTGASITHTFTKSNAIILASGFNITGAAAVEARIRIVAGAVNGTNYGGTYLSATRVGDTFDILTGLSTGSPVTVKLQLASTTGGVSVSVPGRDTIAWLIIEFD